MFRRAIASVCTVTGARSFATTPVARASGFTVFIKQAYKNKAMLKELSVLPITARGRLLGKKYRALPATEKKKLAAAASKIKVVRRKKTTKKRALSAYNKFVRQASKSAAIKALPFNKRMAAIAKLWNRA